MGVIKILKKWTEKAAIINNQLGWIRACKQKSSININNPKYAKYWSDIIKLRRKLTNMGITINFFKDKKLQIGVGLAKAKKIARSDHKPTKFLHIVPLVIPLSSRKRAVLKLQEKKRATITDYEYLGKIFFRIRDGEVNINTSLLAYIMNRRKTGQTSKRITMALLNIQKELIEDLYVAGKARAYEKQLQTVVAIMLVFQIIPGRSRSITNNNIHLFRSGRWSELIDPIVDDLNLENSQQIIPKNDETITSNSRKIATLYERSKFSTAFQCLRGQTQLRWNEDNIQEFKDKNYTQEHWDHSKNCHHQFKLSPRPNRKGHKNMKVDPAILESSIHKIRWNNSSGPDNQPPQAFWQLIGDTHLEGIIEMVINNQLSPAAVKILDLSYAIPLGKPDGGLRPIAFASFIIRTISRVVVASIGPNMENLLTSTSRHKNYCLSKNGTTKCLQRLRKLLIDEPDKTIVSIDFKNAFNSVDRNKLFQVVQDLAPELYSYVIARYQEPSILLCKNDARGRCILSTRGVIQGDPLSPLLYSLVQFDMFNKVSESIEGIESSSFADDALIFPTFKKDNNKITQFIKDLINQGESTGLIISRNRYKVTHKLATNSKENKVINTTKMMVQKGKSQYLSGHNMVNKDLDNLGFSRHVLNVDDPSSQPFKYLGAFPEDVHEEHREKIYETIQQRCKDHWEPIFNDLGNHRAQIQLNVLMAIRRATTYMMRNQIPHPHQLPWFDKQVQETFRRIGDFAAWTSYDNTTNFLRNAPTNMGGCGMTDSKLLWPIAFVASTLDVANDLQMEPDSVSTKYIQEYMQRTYPDKGTMEISKLRRCLLPKPTHKLQHFLTERFFKNGFTRHIEPHLATWEKILIKSNSKKGASFVFRLQPQGGRLYLANEAVMEYMQSRLLIIPDQLKWSMTQENCLHSTNCCTCQFLSKFDPLDRETYHYTSYPSRTCKFGGITKRHNAVADVLQKELAILQWHREPHHSEVALDDHLKQVNSLNAIKSNTDESSPKSRLRIELALSSVYSGISGATASGLTFIDVHVCNPVSANYVQGKAGILGNPTPTAIAAQRKQKKYGETCRKNGHILWTFGLDATGAFGEDALLVLNRLKQALMEKHDFTRAKATKKIARLQMAIIHALVKHQGQAYLASGQTLMKNMTPPTGSHRSPQFHLQDFHALMLEPTPSALGSPPPAPAEVQSATPSHSTTPTSTAPTCSTTSLDRVRSLLQSPPSLRTPDRRAAPDQPPLSLRVQDDPQLHP
eukprot:g411.t1